jgi:hypothetical protein
VVIGSPDLLADLISWSATYLRGLGPLSGIVRLVTTQQLKTISDCHDSGANWGIAAGAVGLITSEIMSLANGVGVDAAAAAAPNSTIAFAILRASSMGLNSDAFIEIGDNCLQIMRDNNRPEMEDIRVASLRMALSLLNQDEFEYKWKDNSRRFRGWIGSLRLSKDIYDVARDIFNSLDLLAIEDVARLDEMTAEQKVEFFDQIAPVIVRSVSATGRLDAAFSLAFAAFICRPGLDQQASLLGEHLQRLPEALVCLGALQEFSSMSEALSIGSGAGWRTARELFRPVEMWAPPRADAAFLEFELLSRSQSQQLRKILSRQRVEIEVYPMIAVALRGSPGGSVRRTVEGQRGSADALNTDMLDRRRLVGIEASLMDALKILGDIRRGEETTDGRPPTRRRK